jgi:apolipoprotein N-acyltransferase
VERRWVNIALGLVAGLLICASLPPWGWWPLAPVGIALWVHLLAAPARRDRFFVSWAVGIAWFGPSTLWMWGLTMPGYVFGVLFGWGPMVAAIGLVTPRDRRRLLVVPAAIVAFEWFHSHAPFGGAPLSMLAMTQARAPMLPVARIGGMLLVGLAVAALGVALYVAVAERRWIEPVAIVAGCALVAGIGAMPLLRPGSASADGGSVRIAAVQGGGPQGTRFSSDQAPLVFERHLELTRTLDGPVDLVVWPENTINISGTFSEHPWRLVLAGEAQRLGAPIMVGIVEDAPNDPDRFLNYVVTVRPDGTLGDRYDKVRRVPFGEYVPLRSLFEPIAGGALPPRDQIPGEGIARLETMSGDVAVAISWEVFFSRRVREGVRHGGEIVVNPTNGSSYWLTQVQSQQLATSALRAVESGRWLAQVAPTGFSAVFDDTGRIIERTGVSEARVLQAEFPRITGSTPAQVLGDLPALLAALVLAAIAVVFGRRSQVEEHRSDEPELDTSVGEWSVDRIP